MTFNSDNLNITGSTYSTAAPNIYDIYEEKKDPELFEKVVQDLILHKYADDEFKEVIEIIDRRDVRLAIMSLIDKETTGDMNISWSEMKAYVDSGLSKMNHVKDVIRIINKFVKDGKTEKKKFGEVMTDIQLVREMLDTLPKEVWSNPNLKWLDPANGCGTFPFVIIYKLMKGLEEWEKDDEKRYKHIVENMIYTCELQSRNVFLWLCGIDPHDEYKVNAYWGSFLDDGFDYHMKNVWKIDKFDIIVGNPPYQHPTNKRWKLWISFLRKINLFNNKYLLFVTPNSWVLGDGEELTEARNIILNKGIKILNNNVNKYFNVGEDIGYYLCDNIKKNEIIVNGDYVSIIDNNIIINNEDIIKKSIYNKLKSENKFYYFNVNTDIKSKMKNGTFSKNKTNTNITRVIHSASNIFYCSDDLSKFQKEGVIINWSGHFYKKNDNKYLYRSIEDVPGRNTKKIFTSTIEESNNLINYISSKLIRFYVSNNKTSGFNTPLYSIPKIDLSKKWTDQELYDLFLLTKEEIDLIENNVKN